MPLRSVDFQVLEKNWGWFLALGIGLVVLGLVALGLSFAMTLAGVMYYGILMLVGGGCEVAHALAARRWSGFLPQVALGVLYLIAGGYLVLRPLDASLVLTLVLGLSILSTGVSRMALGWAIRGARYWRAVLASGLLSLMLGGLILARWPTSSGWVIGLLIAVELISNGCSWITLGLTARTINSRWVPLTTPGRW